MTKFGAVKSAAIVVMLSICVGAGADSVRTTTWQKIDVESGTYHTTDGNGIAREITPSCSGGPVCTADPATGKPNCRLGNKQFSFYYKPGKDKKKLIVYFDGGGACWDANTCVTGAQTRLPTYVPELSGTVSTEGIFDLNNKKNPYRNWSMAVIPYCTADIHFGSNDQQYPDFTGAVTGTPGGMVTIHHRGFDNFLYVRDWLMKRYDGDHKNGHKSDKDHESEKDDKVKKLLVTGSSAGGYGAIFAYPHLRQAFPDADGYLMADGSSGVVSDTLMQQALRLPEARWGATQNIVTAIPQMNGIFDLPATTFLPAFYSALAGYYPEDRFSQYTTLFDIIQVLFYNISLNQNNIPAWFAISPQVYADWSNQTAGRSFALSALPNYRFYVAGGCNHTLLRFNDDFYSGLPTSDTSFLSWFKALTREEEDGTYSAKWVNSFCAGCTQPPTPPTAQEINACLQRSFGR